MTVAQSKRGTIDFLDATSALVTISKEPFIISSWCKSLAQLVLAQTRKKSYPLHGLKGQPTSAQPDEPLPADATRGKRLVGRSRRLPGSSRPSPETPGPTSPLARRSPTSALGRGSPKKSGPQLGSYCIQEPAVVHGTLYWLAKAKEHSPRIQNVGPKLEQPKWLWLKKPVPKWNPGKWKHGPKPA